MLTGAPKEDERSPSCHMLTGPSLSVARTCACDDGRCSFRNEVRRRFTMPVYEFVCRDCQKTFEIIRPMSESSASVTCIHCGSTKVERIWSTVYAVTSKKS